MADSGGSVGMMIIHSDTIFRYFWDTTFVIM
jgi:hypothetical protein